VHTLPGGEGVAAGVFLEAHDQAFQKRPELHLQPQVKYPKFNPKIPKNPENLGDYGKSSSKVR